MTDRPAPRLALTPDEAAALLQADELASSVGFWRCLSKRPLAEPPRCSADDGRAATSST